MTLSDKIIQSCEYPQSEYPSIDVEDVKQSINRVKERIKDSEFKLDPKNLMWEDVCMIMDEEFGDAFATESEEKS